MSINLSALANVTTAATAFGDLILVTPNKPVGYQAQNKDPNPLSILPLDESFFFDYEGEQAVNLTSDITDHYVEDNTAIADQIALKPEEVMTSGFVGELNDIAPPILQPAKQLADKLTVLGAYTPVLSTTAILAYVEAKFLYDVALQVSNSVIQTWQFATNTLDPSKVQTKQQKAFLKFYGYWKDRRLFTIQTPWAIFKDMAIKSLRSVQPNDDQYISTFEITFKKMRFASTKIILTKVGTVGQFQAGRTKTAGEQLVKKTSTPTETKPITEVLP